MQSVHVVMHVAVQLRTRLTCLSASLQCHCNGGGGRARLAVGHVLPDMGWRSHRTAPLHNHIRWDGHAFRSVPLPVQPHVWSPRIAVDVSLTAEFMVRVVKHGRSGSLLSFTSKRIPKTRRKRCVWTGEFPSQTVPTHSSQMHENRRCATDAGKLLQGTDALPFLHSDRRKHY
jgi:hypothetical protein